jgi:transposase-like protein
MRSTRKIDDEEDARRCLAAAGRSGLTPRDWARENGVDARSLNTWRINLGRRRAVGELQPAALTLVELVPRRATASEQARSFGARYVLELGGARLEFGDDVSAATLRRVVEVLRSC